MSEFQKDDTLSLCNNRDLDHDAASDRFNKAVLGMVQAFMLATGLAIDE